MTFGSASSQTMSWDKSMDEGGGGRGGAGWEHYQTKLGLSLGLGLRLRQLKQKQLGWDGADGCNGCPKQGRQHIIVYHSVQI